MAVHDCAHGATGHPTILSARRALPLGHLRAALFRHDDQLHRPAGVRDSRAGDEEDFRMERRGLYRHRFLVRGRLRHRTSELRAGARLDRHPHRIRVRDDFLERREHAARGNGEHLRLQCCAIPARPRRVGQLSGFDQIGGRVVSEEGTRACDRHLQRRLERRRGHRAGRSAVDLRDVGLAVGLPRHGRDRLRLACLLAARLSPAGDASAPVPGRAGLHPQRPRRDRPKR